MNAVNDMQAFYESSEDFKNYVDKHCRTYGVTKEEAFNNMMVQIVAKHYKEQTQETHHG